MFPGFGRGVMRRFTPGRGLARVEGVDSAWDLPEASTTNHFMTGEEEDFLDAILLV